LIFRLLPPPFLRKRPTYPRLSNKKLYAAKIYTKNKIFTTGLIDATLAKNPGDSDFMPTPQETAYPILKTKIPKETLKKIYTPSADEVVFVKKHSHTPQNRACMLTLLKCAQRLGYFVLISSIPRSIPEYIAKHVDCRCTLKMLRFYDDARARSSHINKIRAYLNIKPADKKAHSTAIKAMEHATYTKEDIVDILNVGIEELIRLRYELPRFDHLLRMAYQARKKTNAAIYTSVYQAIPTPTRHQLNQLLNVDPETNRSLWHQLRQDAGKVTIKEMDKAIERLQWIRSLDFPFDPFSSIPYVKFRHFAMEAKSLNANRADEIVQPKKAVLLAAMVKSALARTIDDIMIMIVKKVGKIHRAGKIKLDEYLESNRDNTDRIVTSYMSIHEHAYDENETDPEKKLAAIQQVFAQSPELVDFSAQHTVYGSKNYFRFLRPLFRGSRAAFFKAMNQLEFVSSSSDQALVQAIAFARAHHGSRSMWVSRETIDPDSGQTVTMDDLSWIPDKWWYLVTGLKRRQQVPEKINRHQFEICLFSELVNELKCADMCIVDSEDFSDPTDQLVSMEELCKKLPKYAEVVGLPIDTAGFIAHIKKYLNT
jgi:hypothetical protein